MTDSATAREISVAVVREKGSFELASALLDAPRDDEVLVRIVATGLCHTDLVVRDQVYPVPPPVVLGHEGRLTRARKVADSGERGTFVTPVKVGKCLDPTGRYARGA
ncbi:alcohol dehydrogenase catalytic domain-containing protein [Streptomyces sp. NBC_01635]|uniref:alcohol dehydrogenase catalytic domain-containing protein n=1 Tax=Streptomyces sp. NBC_01635 TaxID=2975904 RepID=UPI00386AB7EA